MVTVRIPAASFSDGTVINGPCSTGLTDADGGILVIRNGEVEKELVIE